MSARESAGGDLTARLEEMASVEDEWHEEAFAACAREAAATIRALRAENEALRDTLRYIADEESGWRFRVDPLEHARSVIEEMRDMARRALHPASEDPAGPATPGEETTR